MATLASDTFTGTNGAAWSATWTTGITPSGGGTQIQSNAGRLTTGSATGYSFSGWVTRRVAGSTQADVQQAMRVKFNGQELYPLLWARASSTSLDGSAGYALAFNPSQGGYVIAKYVGGTGSDLVSFQSYTFTTGTYYWVKFAVIGTSLKAKVWVDGAAEPDWLVSATDSTHTTGYYGIGVLSGNAGLATLDVDDYLAQDVATTVYTGTATATAAIGYSTATIRNATATATGAVGIPFTTAGAVSRTGTATTSVGIGFTADATRTAPSLGGSGVHTISFTAFVEGPNSSTATARLGVGLTDGLTKSSAITGTGQAFGFSFTGAAITSPTVLQQYTDALAGIGVRFAVDSFSDHYELYLPSYKTRLDTKHRFWRRISIDTGYTLLKDADGFYRMVVDPTAEETTTAAAYYQGGRVYFISALEAGNLLNAGYGDYITNGGRPLPPDVDLPGEGVQYGQGLYGRGSYDIEVN